MTHGARRGSSRELSPADALVLALRTPLFDMHCHLGFAPDAEEIAVAYAAGGEGLFSCGVDPARYEGERNRLTQAAQCASEGSASCGIRVGLGLHPWWLKSVGEPGVDAFLQQVEAAPYVGEIGLDAGARYGADFPDQLQAFHRICAQIAAHPGKVVSLHAVKSVDAVLDVLEQTGALADNACILHWFTGTSQQLTRAVRAGCYVSLGIFSLSSKRGRAYARQVPPGRLLLETDYPPEQGERAGYAGMHDPLVVAAQFVAQTCGQQGLEAACAASRQLLGVNGDNEHHG